MPCEITWKGFTLHWNSSLETFIWNTVVYVPCFRVVFCSCSLLQRGTPLTASETWRSMSKPRQEDWRCLPYTWKCTDGPLLWLPSLAFDQSKVFQSLQVRVIPSGILFLTNVCNLVSTNHFSKNFMSRYGNNHGVQHIQMASFYEFYWFIFVDETELCVL